MTKQDPASLELTLETLCLGEMPALTTFEGGSLAEAASVALQAQGHLSPVRLAISGINRCAASLTFLEVTDQMRLTHGDPIVATERGACGVAILLAMALCRYTVVQRSYKGTGVDYFLGHHDDFLFQNKARLEVSGIARGGKPEIKRRMRMKLRRVNDRTPCRSRQLLLS